jgi:hypothetical protein
MVHVAAVPNVKPDDPSFLSQPPPPLVSTAEPKPAAAAAVQLLHPPPASSASPATPATTTMSSSPPSAKAADSSSRQDESRMTGVAPSEFASIPRGWSPLVRVQQDGLLVFDRLPELERGLALGFFSQHANPPPPLMHLRTPAPVDFDTLYCLLELTGC